MNRDRINSLLNRVPTHVIIILTILVWILPTIGLLVTSLRPRQDVNNTGWWTVLSPSPGAQEYSTFCSSCHGTDGRKLPNANLADPNFLAKFPRSFQLITALGKPINGKPHMGNIPQPDPQQAAPQL